MKPIIETNDHLDPCPLCCGVTCDICGWDCQDDMAHIDDHWYFIHVDGTPVTHLYRTNHPTCQASVDAYQAEVARENAAWGIDA